MTFLKNVLATILGFFISLGIFFIIFLIFMSVMMSSIGSTDSAAVIVKDNSVLELEFKMPLRDYGEKVYLEDFDYTIEEYNGLNSILKAIKHASTDSKIKGILLKSSGNLSGLALVRELRVALEDFKTSGKFIYAYNDVIPQSDYYLQTVADKIYVSPLGKLNFRGLSSEVLFFKDLQDNTGVSMEVIRHGKYKSAVEPFLDNKMSDENRLQIKELLSSVWDIIVQDIAESRAITVEDLNAIATNLEARTPQLALKNKMVDGVLFQDEFENILCEAMNVSKIEDVNYINIEEYTESVSKKYSKKAKDKIAVIYAEGEIMYGSGSSKIVGDKTIVESLRKAVKNNDVKAIVLRVNSPGGSVLASELIHREIAVTKQHKNVYVSMGNYAASGGYYIACHADKIFAEAGTITGSIGVFGAVPNVSKLAEKWGVNAEQVTTHSNALEYSLFEKPSKSFIDENMESVEQIYELFLERVAEGRGMTTEQVNEIAQGRVWSGKDALRLGLVDQIGTLDNVLEFVANEKGLESYSVVSYPLFKTSLKEMFGTYAMSLKSHSLQEELGKEAYQMYEKIKLLSQQEGIQARMLFDVSLD
ncbi:signal peptide peptidase SppA [Capnocytophaga sp. H2931]|uniref:signal peptide peptidase SppA n=1 Tax=Capnocytophaga sp. H2931 TaxID=1945657 RepID=UPI000BB18059|nr:signal peptide peptidase SppA [Capnocytophaga sp. H2931]ATA75182.1 signal peptide peptidase SppA [Capnocytophaga sp. H2931]